MSDAPARVIAGPSGDPTDSTHALATNLSFSPAGQFFVAAWRSKKSGLAMYTSAGELEASIGGGLVGDGVKGVAFAASGELVVCTTTDYPYADSKIQVLSSDGTTHVRTWGCSGVCHGEFVYPTMLVTAGQYLFVMDSGRIQRFQ